MRTPWNVIMSPQEDAEPYSNGLVKYVNPVLPEIFEKTNND